MRGKCWHQPLGTVGPLVLSARQVIRQTGGTYRQGHGATEGEKGKGEGEDDCGTAPYPLVWVCSPGGPLLSWTGMQRADNRVRG